MCTLVKGKAMPVQASTEPECYRRLKLPDSKRTDTWSWKRQPYVSAAFTAPGIIPSTHWCRVWVDPRDIVQVDELRQRKVTWTLGNRTRDIAVFSELPQPAELPCAVRYMQYMPRRLACCSSTLSHLTLLLMENQNACRILRCIQ